jgi:hypothetical protein
MKGWKRLAFPTANVLFLVALAAAGAATMQAALPTGLLHLVVCGCAAAALLWSSEEAPCPPGGSARGRRV